MSAWDLRTAFADGQTVKWTTSAALTWLAYDIVITFGKEVELVWKRPVTVQAAFISAIYILTRYFSLAYLIIIFTVGTMHNLSFKFCDHFFKWYSAFGIAYLVCATSALLVLRLRAALQSRRILMWAVIAVAFSECVCILVILGITVSREKTLILPPEIPLPGCQVEGVPHLLTGAWVVNVVASAVYLSVTMYVVISSVRQAGSAGQTITTLSRHGIVAFVVVLGVALFSYLWARFSRGMLVALALPWLAATLGVTSSRLVLGLRSLGQAQEDKVHIIPTATATSSVRGSYDHRSLFGSTWKAFDGASASARTSMEPRAGATYEPRASATYERRSFGSVASAVPPRMFGSTGSAVPPRAFGSMGSAVQPRTFGSMGSAVPPRAFGSTGSAVVPRALGSMGSAVQPRAFGSVGSSSRPTTGASDVPLLEDVALEDDALEDVPL